MGSRGKRSLKPSPTEPQKRSSSTSMRSEAGVGEADVSGANSRKDGEADPGSKREAGCEVVGRA